MTSFFHAERAVARCLWVTPEHVYVGTCHEADRHELAILDKHGKVAKTWRTPYLVSDVAIAGDACHASLGPGYLMTWSQRGFSKTKGEVRQVDANAPRLATYQDELWWGTAWGEIHKLTTGYLTNVKKWLGGICVDADRVYAAYDDGKVRVFSRTGKRVKQLAVGSRGTRCAIGDDTLVTIDQMSGEATIWTPAFEEKARFTHEHSAKWGVIGLEVFGSHIVSHTYEDLQVHDDRGRKLGAWTCPGRLEDAWLDGDEVYIAAGPHVHRVALGDLAS